MSTYSFNKSIFSNPTVGNEISNKGVTVPSENIISTINKFPVNSRFSDFNLLIEGIPYLTSTLTFVGISEYKPYKGPT